MIGTALAFVAGWIVLAVGALFLGTAMSVSTRRRQLDEEHRSLWMLAHLTDSNMWLSTIVILLSGILAALALIAYLLAEAL